MTSRPPHCPRSLHRSHLPRRNLTSPAANSPLIVADLSVIDPCAWSINLRNYFHPNLSGFAMADLSVKARNLRRFPNLFNS